MNVKFSKQKHGLTWWFRAHLTLMLVLVTATWITGAVVKYNNLKQNPAPGQLVPYFCANTATFYSLMQAGGISIR